MLIHKFIWAIFEKLLHRLLQLLFSTEALDLLSELKKKVFASQINQHYYFMISWSTLVSCVAPSFTTSSIKSFRLVRFVAQSKTTWQHFPKNHYFHYFHSNLLSKLFVCVWRYVKRSPVVWEFSFQISFNQLQDINWMEIPSPVLKTI